MRTFATGIARWAVALSLVTVAGAAGAASVGFAPPGTNVAVGDRFEMQIVVREFDGLAGGIVDFQFSDDVLDVESVVVAPRWEFQPDGGSLAAPGRWEEIGFDSFANDPLVGGGTIATVTFLAEAAGQASVDILDTSVFFGEFAVIDPDRLDGTRLSSDTVTVVSAVPVPAALVLLLSALGLTGAIGARTRSV